MSLYQLEQQDINEILELISSDSLPIKASRAGRVFQLQAMLSKLQPIIVSLECEVCAARKAAELEKEKQT
jgi:hypothetical protein